MYQFQPKSEKSVFSVDTPPPYVSAEHLHAGHIMSYAQAEFIVRFKRMQGFNVFYPMGFDDNGLPTERFVEKKYKLDKSKVSRQDFIKLCLKETKTGAQNYKKLWHLLGISIDWSQTYSTIDDRCRKISQKSFLDLFKKNLVYRAEQPTMWCPACQTALAQADLEDKQERTYLNYIKFFPVGNADLRSLQIATTRPELLEACVALFYHPEDKRYKNLKKAKLPIFNFEVPVLTDKNVDPKFGTGLIMVCAWGDTEDIRKWQEHKLETRPIFTEKTKPEEILKKRQDILEKLKQKNLLIKQEQITHALNVHERCETPVEFVLTKQWFIKILENKNDLLKRGEELKWFPEFMKRRYFDWVKNLKWDWCISRQRYYGVPFPVWYCQNCGGIILAENKNLPVDPTE
ncbi:MAG: valine--tRNA ligase, partial [Candidatus Portnoybacteria bacterium CG23_combo_of_CG06-09_8_20_14_all_37_13]